MEREAAQLAQRGIQRIRVAGRRRVGQCGGQQPLRGRVEQLLAAMLQVHQVRAARQLHIALVAAAQAMKQPRGIAVVAHAVPFAAHDQRRRSDACRLVRQGAGPRGSDVGLRPGGDLHHRHRLTRRRLRVAGQIRRSPLRERRLDQHRPLAGRHVLDEARQLLLDADEPPAADFLHRRSTALRRRAEHHQPFDVLRMQAGVAAGDQRAPRVRQQRHPLALCTGAHQRDDARELRHRVVDSTDRRPPAGVGLEAARTLGAAIAGEVEGPDIEAARGEIVHPRAAVEAIGHRQRRRKGRAMHIDHARSGAAGVAHEQRGLVRGAGQVQHSGVVFIRHDGGKGVDRWVASLQHCAHNASMRIEPWMQPPPSTGWR